MKLKRVKPEDIKAGLYIRTNVSMTGKPYIELHCVTGVPFKEYNSTFPEGVWKVGIKGSYDNEDYLNDMCVYSNCFKYSTKLHYKLKSLMKDRFEFLELLEGREIPLRERRDLIEKWESEQRYMDIIFGGAI